MSNSSVIDEQLRTIERAATKAAQESAAPGLPHFADQRNAEEMIRLIQEKHEKAGARPDALAATVKAGRTAYRLEVTLGTAAAEAIYGSPNEPTNSSRVPVQSGTSGNPKSWARRVQPDFALRQLETSDPIQRLLLALPPESKLPSWMESVLKLDESNETDLALDELFSRVDSLLTGKCFDQVDELLAAMPIEGPSLSLMLGILSITLPAADQLPSRAHYFTRVYRLCKAMRRDAESLLGGLRWGDDTDGSRPFGK